MMKKITSMLSDPKSSALSVAIFLRKNWYYVAATLLIFIWCLPYFTTGTRIEWGDFSFFAQAYEAIRRSILDYHQFPWWNPWMAGGVPLYANPQMGVFSIQTVFVLFFGAAIGLKLAIVAYTYAGYVSMNVLLRKYFKVEPKIAALLGLMWLFTTFFVAHLPAHFTFVWYMLAPLYIYFALALKDWKGGLKLGIALAIMALSQIHNPFFHISLICVVILGVRFVRLLIAKQAWRPFVYGLGATAGSFLLLAGHRAALTVANVRDFPHSVFDPAVSPLTSGLGVLLPYPSAHPHTFRFLDLGALPTPYGFGEITGSIGTFGNIAILLSLLFILYKTRGKVRQALQQFGLPLLLVGAALTCFALGFGAFTKYAPYSLLKHLPVFSEMRVASRWFIFFDLSMLAFIGLTLKKAPRASFYRFATTVILVIGVAELFFINIGYQSNVFSHDLSQPKQDTSHLPFIQTSMFGSLQQLPDGQPIPGTMDSPHFYREYEATLFNMGVLQANDSLVDLNVNHNSPRCPWEKGCGLVLSGNAVVASWSPNKIVLRRTGKGPITLNINDSNYFVINGKRESGVKAAEAFRDFIIHTPDTVQTITIQAKPSVKTSLSN